MGINMKTKQFEKDLVDTINKSGLPPCIVEMVMQNALAGVHRQVELALQAEAAAEKEVTKDAEGVQPDKLGELSK